MDQQIEKKTIEQQVNEFKEVGLEYANEKVNELLSVDALMSKILDLW